MTTFAERLKAARKAAHMSQEDLEKATWIRQQLLSKYEAGDHEPSWANIQKLAAALGVSLADLAYLEPFVSQAKGSANAPRADAGGFVRVPDDYPTTADPRTLI